MLYSKALVRGLLALAASASAVALPCHVFNMGGTSRSSDGDVDGTGES